jgi:hypothetical protein
MQLARKSCYPKVGTYHYYKNLGLPKGSVYKQNPLFALKARGYSTQVGDGDGDSIVSNVVNIREVGQLNTFDRNITETKNLRYMETNNESSLKRSSMIYNGM